MRKPGCPSIAIARGLVAALALAAGCADFRAPATFPREAAHQPLIEEQALLALDAAGDARVASLWLAEGRPAALELLQLDHQGDPARTIARAPPEVAAQVAARLEQAGSRLEPLLGPLALAYWDDARDACAAGGFAPAQAALPEPGTQRWSFAGASGLPLSLRIAPTSSGPPAVVLLLSEQPGVAPDSDEAELLRMPTAGRAVAPALYLAGRTAWMLSGSVLEAGTLHRVAGLRRASLARGEAMLHNQHALADYGAGDLEAARRELDRALLADPRYLDALYNQASVAALEGRDDEAVSFLRRAAEEDPRRVQVLGRDDTDLRTLRRRPDVREILGLARMPPGE